MSDIDSGVYSLKTELPQKGRCPKCTLKVPCKHYQSPNEIPDENPYMEQKPHTEEALERKYLRLSSNEDWKTEKFYDKSPRDNNLGKFEPNSNLIEFMDGNIEKL